MFLSSVSVYSGWPPCPSPIEQQLSLLSKRAPLVEWQGHVRNQPSDLRASRCWSWEGAKSVVVRSFLSFNICSLNEIPSKNPVEEADTGLVLSGSKGRRRVEEKTNSFRPFSYSTPAHSTTWKSGKTYIWFWASTIQAKSLIRNNCSLIGQVTTSGVEHSGKKCKRSATWVIVSKPDLNIFSFSMWRLMRAKLWLSCFFFLFPHLFYPIIDLLL